MTGRKTSRKLKCLALALALAGLAAPMVQARAATKMPATATNVPGTATTFLRADGAASGSDQFAWKQLSRKGSSTSYFWAEAGIAAAVLVGFVVLGLWGDAAIGGLIVGVGVVASSVALIARKACPHERDEARPAAVLTDDELAEAFRAAAALIRERRLEPLASNAATARLRPRLSDEGRFSWQWRRREVSPS